MWSDRYYYLNIYKDQSLSEDTDTRELIKFLDTIPELEKKGRFAFKNKGTFPFFTLLLLKAKNLHNWSENDSDPTKTNLYYDRLWKRGTQRLPRATKGLSSNSFIFGLDTSGRRDR